MRQGQRLWVYTHGDPSALSLRLFGEDLTQTGPDMTKKAVPEAEADAGSYVHTERVVEGKKQYV